MPDMRAAPCAASPPRVAVIFVHYDRLRPKERFLFLVLAALDAADTIVCRAGKEVKAFG